MMTRTQIGAAAVLALLVLAGCSSNSNRSLSEYQCAAGDWFAVGELDGRNGYGQARLLVHQDACGPQGIVPDSSSYRQGWSAGVAQYCEPSRGYRQGLSGRNMPTVCPQQHLGEYRDAYDQGRALFTARRDVAGLERAIAQAEQRIDRLNTDAIQLGAAQLAGGLSPQERVRLATQVQEMLAEKQRLQRDLPHLRGELQQALAHLAAVESEHPRLAGTD